MKNVLLKSCWRHPHNQMARADEDVSSQDVSVFPLMFLSLWQCMPQWSWNVRAVGCIASQADKDLFVFYSDTANKDRAKRNSARERFGSLKFDNFWERGPLLDLLRVQNQSAVYVTGFKSQLEQKSQRVIHLRYKTHPTRPWTSQIALCHYYQTASSPAGRQDLKWTQTLIKPFIFVLGVHWPTLAYVHVSDRCHTLHLLSQSGHMTVSASQTSFLQHKKSTLFISL